MYENIKYEVKGNLGYLTINRPKALNALNTEVLSELADALKEIETDDAVKA
ncbi:MAG: enoyl-CoA hydratase-related protein, partial [Hornefia butyriciproducens]|nr:enoyl-CoA hydratase-related protein [Hornefia butyriciproducens]